MGKAWPDKKMIILLAQAGPVVAHPVCETSAKYRAVEIIRNGLIIEDGNPASIHLTNRWNGNPAISDSGNFPV